MSTHDSSGWRGSCRRHVGARRGPDVSYSCVRGSRCHGQIPAPSLGINPDAPQQDPQPPARTAPGQSSLSVSFCVSLLSLSRAYRCLVRNLGKAHSGYGNATYTKGLQQGWGGGGTGGWMGGARNRAQAETMFCLAQAVFLKSKTKPIF